MSLEKQKGKRRSEGTTDLDESATKRIQLVALPKDHEASLKYENPSDAIQFIAPIILLKILTADPFSQNLMTRRLWSTGSPWIQKLLVSANTEYTMSPCLKFGYPCGREMCYCVRLGSIVLPNVKSLLITMKGDGHLGARNSGSSIFLKPDMLNLPPGLTQLKIGNTELGSYTWWTLKSNILKHIPNAANMSFLSIGCVIPNRCYNSFIKFENLTTLIVHTYKHPKNEIWLKYLPQSLTAFSCPHASISTKEVASSLPKSLTALSVETWSHKIPIINYLQHLVHLETVEIDSKCISHLPSNLEMFATCELIGSPCESIWPASINYIIIDDNNSFHSRHRYPAGLVNLAYNVEYQSLLDGWSLPFAACSTTLRMLHLDLTCLFEPEYFEISQLVSLVYLRMNAKYATQYRGFGGEYLRLLKLPPSIEYLLLKLDLSYEKKAPMDIHIVPFSTKECYPYLENIAISCSYKSWTTTVDISMPIECFPKLARFSLRLPRNDLLVTLRCYYNGTCSSNDFHPDRWFHIKVNGTRSDLQRNSTSSNDWMNRVRIENLNRLCPARSPWKMKHPSI